MPEHPAIMILGGAATQLQMLVNAPGGVPVVGLVIGVLAQAADTLQRLDSITALRTELNGTIALSWDGDRM